MARILLYTGKGGVGKTSIAAATAVACAERGYRTVVLSTDIAHSLGDALDVELGPEPREIAPNLWAQESEVFFNVHKYWGSIQSYAASVLRWRGLDEVLAEEMTILPGMDEIGSLLWIAEHHDRGDFDVIVVDAAPTGETLRLLSLPEAARWWVDKLAPIGRRISKLAGPIVNRVIGMPIPDEHVFDAGEELLLRLEHIHELLADPEKTSIRVVLTLEKVVIKEAQRSFTFLHLYGYPTDLVVANRLLPEESGYLLGWYNAQRAYWPMVEDSFAPVPVRSVPFFNEELVGLDNLRQVSAALFGDDDPTAHYYKGRPYAVRRENGSFVLSLQLPFTSREEIELTRRADELLVEVGTWRRNIVLPRVVVDAAVEGAQFEDHTLKIRFTAPATGQRAGSKPGAKPGGKR